MAKIKICGLTRPEDILAANELLPDYVGFVFAKSRRQVTAAQAEALVSMLDPAISPVGVFVNEKEDVILDLVQKKIIRMVQLHGQETPKDAERLKERLKAWHVPVMKAIRMDSPDALLPWKESSVDYLLLDAGSGGTGTMFDHTILDHVGPIGKPWFLAGGMNPENAPALVKRYSPYAVDVSSGVETDGKKDPKKMEKMVRAVRGHA